MDKIDIPLQLAWTITKLEANLMYDSKILSTEPYITQISGVSYTLSLLKQENKLVVKLTVVNTERLNVKIKCNVKVEAVGININIQKESDEDLSNVVTLCKFKDAFEKFVDNKLNISLTGNLTCEYEMNAAELDIPSVGPELYADQESKDLKIIVDGKEINVHKNVISLKSTKMKFFIRNDKLEIPDFTFKVVDATIKYAYGVAVAALKIEEFIKMLRFADKYDIALVKGNLEAHILKIVNELTITKAIKEAAAAELVILFDSCKKKLFSMIQQNKNICNLNLLDSEIILEIAMMKVKKWGSGQILEFVAKETVHEARTTYA